MHDLIVDYVLSCSEHARNVDQCVCTIAAMWHDRRSLARYQADVEDISLPQASGVGQWEPVSDVSVTLSTNT